MRHDDIKLRITEWRKTVPWLEHVTVSRDGLGVTQLDLNYGAHETVLNDGNHRADVHGACHRLLDRFQKHIDSARKELDKGK